MEKLPAITVPEEEPEAFELEHRCDSNLDVKLMWHRPTNTPYMVVEEIGQKHAYAFVVAPENCHDAFNHPYPYMNQEGLIWAEGVVRGKV